MKVYNPSRFPMDFPLDNGSRIRVAPKEVSSSFFPTTKVLKNLTTAYSTKDVVFLVDSRSEYDLIASVSAAPAYTMNSLEEAIKKFADPTPEVAAKVPETTTPVEDEVPVEVTMEAKEADENSVVEEDSEETSKRGRKRKDQ